MILKKTMALTYTDVANITNNELDEVKKLYDLRSSSKSIYLDLSIQ